MEFTVLLFYKYIFVQNPEKLRDTQRELCQRLNLRGRVIVANEGINATLEGRTQDTQKYIEYMNADKRFKDINWKKSKGTGSAFRKLSVKVRPEIVTTGIENKDFGPLKKVTGKYLSAQDLKKWYEQDKEFYVIDMRNDYEYEVGRFKNSLLPKGLYHFRDVPKVVDTIKDLKDKTIVTVCTGGVRCETASGLLMKYGFKDVYQLQHGIVTFMEKYPNTFFQGKLLVFDGRETMGFNTDSPEYEMVGKCRICGSPSEHLVNYWKNGVDTYGVVCEDCVSAQKVKLSR